MANFGSNAHFAFDNVIEEEMSFNDRFVAQSIVFLHNNKTCHVNDFRFGRVHC